MDRLLSRGWLLETPPAPGANRVWLRPTEEGAAALSDIGVSLPAARPGNPIAYCCLDWTERRWHLGGALGRAVVDALERSGCIIRSPGTRVVELASPFNAWLDQMGV